MVQFRYHLKIIMVYILETEINDNKLINIALIYIFGINISLSNKICKLLGLNKNLKLKNLTKEQKNSLFLIINYLKVKINYNLLKYKVDNHKRLINIKNYKGFRKLNKLPVRGQRTHTNAKNCKK